MWNVNKQNLLNFLLLFSSLHGIRGESSVVKEQRKISPETLLKNNFSQIQGGTVITSAGTDGATNVDDLGATEKRNSGKYGQGNVTVMTHRLKRNSSYGGLLYKKDIDCISCITSAASPHGAYCYEGLPLSKERCSSPDQCYTEIHPNFIRRGCTSVLKLNMTFVCNCHMCNDKPFNDTAPYFYEKLGDWQYDMHRLMKPRPNVVCKVCRTTEFKLPSDTMCKDGKKVDYMTCPEKHVCYTNIDHKTDFVSRGCIKMPIYNSMFIFCNGSLCNNVTYSQFRASIPSPMSALKRARVDNLSRRTLKSRNSVDKISSKIIVIILSACFHSTAVVSSLKLQT